MTTFQEAFEEAEASLADVSENEPVEAELPTDDVDLPVDEGGQEADRDGGAESAPAESKTYFDIGAVGDQLVQVNVNGEVLEVPLKDLPNGYMRNASFTQKSQELAEARREHEAQLALAAAYVENPQATIRFLAEQNGITLAEAKAIAEDAEEDSRTETQPPINDPRLDRFEQRFAELDRQEARAELDRTLEALGERYGSDFDANEVVEAALEAGTSDLEGVYKQIAFDRIRARSDAERTASERRAAEEAKVNGAKQALGSVVSSGGSAAGAGDAGTAPITSVAAALEMALAASGDPWA
jgi:predicted metal-dependent phosphoesterase TrpH